MSRMSEMCVMNAWNFGKRFQLGVRRARRVRPERKVEKEIKLIFHFNYVCVLEWMKYLENERGDHHWNKKKINNKANNEGVLARETSHTADITLQFVKELIWKQHELNDIINLSSQNTHSFLILN